MSLPLISRNDDLRRLVSDGYSIEIVGAQLVVRDVPFVDSGGLVHHDGFLVMPLELAGEVVQPPPDHTASFGGGVPCTSTGADLGTVVNGRGTRDVGHGLIVECSCSMKPLSDNGRYPDFYAKATKYVAAIAGHAAAVEPTATATTFRTTPDTDPKSPFNYLDTASSRAGVDALNERLCGETIGIVGLGGTGSYILDFVAKTVVAEIHLFDGDELRSHNTFRAPGATSIDTLNASPKKVEYLARMYAPLRRGIITHPVAVDEANVEKLRAMSFVFLAVDEPEAKRPIVDALVEFGTPFIDVGMGIDNIDNHLTGSLRTTIVTPNRTGPLEDSISFEAIGDDVYRSNIQVVELNARNATDAVIAWKKFRGFYADLEGESSSVYTVSTNHIVNSGAASRVADEPLVA